MHISKLDAARRQLDTAINLYFKDADPVSVHTLTAAAHQILMDIGKLERVKSVIKDASLTIIKKDKHKEYLAMINSAENFFKHAKADPKGLLEFHPVLTETMLLDAVEMYIQLSHEMPEDMSIYHAWFLLQHPNLISESTKNKLKEHNLDYFGFSKKTNKLNFFKLVKENLLDKGMDF